MPRNPRQSNCSLWTTRSPKCARCAQRSPARVCRQRASHRRRRVASAAVRTLRAAAHGSADARHGWHRAAGFRARDRSGAVGIVMTGHGTIDTAVKAMQAGALDYIQKPFKLKAILPVLRRGLEIRTAAQRERRAARDAGDDPPLQRRAGAARARAHARARSGESGARAREQGSRVLLVLGVARLARAVAYDARLLRHFHPRNSARACHPKGACCSSACAKAGRE